MITTDLDQRFKNQHPFSPNMGLQFGVFGLSVTQNICDLSDVHVPASTEVCA